MEARARAVEQASLEIQRACDEKTQSMQQQLDAACHE